MISHRLEEIKIHGWESRQSDRMFELNQSSIDQMSVVIEGWRSVFPFEDTWVWRNYEVPSVIIRLDCVVHDDQVFVYEVEERPAGIGLSSTVNLHFAQRLESLKSKWPEFKVVLSNERSSHDDTLWLEKANGDEHLGLVLVRAEPSEERFHYLSSNAVSTLKTKGDKRYGVALNLWQIVDFEDFDSLPWEDGFVLKPLKGSKCRDVEIWPSKGRIELEGKSLNMRKKLQGRSTRSRIMSTLKKHGQMFVQPFKPSMVCSGLLNHLMIYRFYFGFDPDKKKYVPMNGVWNARPKQQKIHGASDAVFGPLNMA